MILELGDVLQQAEGPVAEELWGKVIGQARLDFEAIAKKIEGESCRVSWRWHDDRLCLPTIEPGEGGRIPGDLGAASAPSTQCPCCLDDEEVLYREHTMGGNFSPRAQPGSPVAAPGEGSPRFVIASDEEQREAVHTTVGNFQQYVQDGPRHRLAGGNLTDISGESSALGPDGGKNSMRQVKAKNTAACLNRSSQSFGLEESRHSMEAAEDEDVRELDAREVARSFHTSALPAETSAPVLATKHAIGSPQHEGPENSKIVPIDMFPYHTTPPWSQDINEGEPTRASEQSATAPTLLTRTYSTWVVEIQERELSRVSEGDLQSSSPKESTNSARSETAACFQGEGTCEFQQDVQPDPQESSDSKGTSAGSCPDQNVNEGQTRWNSFGDASEESVDSMTNYEKMCGSGAQSTTITMLATQEKPSSFAASADAGHAADQVQREEVGVPAVQQVAGQGHVGHMARCEHGCDEKERIKKELAMELKWAQQALESRKEYLRAKKGGIVAGAFSIS